MARPRRVRSLDQAAEFVDRVGIALLFPKADLVVRSLWDAVAGSPAVEWAIRDEHGTFVSFTPEFDRVWRWKDELPERKLACGGKHVARVVALIAPRLVGSLYALIGRPGRPDDFRALDGLTPVQRDVAEAVLEHGPCSGPDLRELLRTEDKKRIDAAVEALQRRLVLTNAGVSRSDRGWPAVNVDVLARRWREQLRRLPRPEDARQTLTATVLEAAGEVSAADVAAVFGWRRRDAEAALDALADERSATVRDEGGVRLWLPAAAGR